MRKRPKTGLFYLGIGNSTPGHLKRLRRALDSRYGRVGVWDQT